MKTLAVLSRKGGTGKTTLAVNLAVAAERAGHRVAIVDLDSQVSASEWGDWREAETPEVISVHSARLPQELHKLKQQGITFALLDTPLKLRTSHLMPQKPQIWQLSRVNLGHLISKP